MDLKVNIKVTFLVPSHYSLPLSDLLSHSLQSDRHLSSTDYICSINEHVYWLKILNLS